MVVVYHVAPGWLPGGYTGVDVFFVISGFLITGGLVARPPKTWRALAEFWARRIRRLLPAAFTVIALACLAAWLIGPASQWRQTARYAVASVLYVQNWNLWRQSLDYLDQGDSPSVFQHFWSLSVEEQFYVAWPVLILIAVWVAARLGRRARPAPIGKQMGDGQPGSAAYAASRRAITLVVAAAFTLSLGWSVWLTPRDPAAAYLVTQTRVWELALGGLLACAWPWLLRCLANRPSVRLVLTAAGFSAMAAAAFGFSDSTLFPGFAALLPTVGSALFIVSGADSRVMSQGSGDITPHTHQAASAAAGERHSYGWLERFWAFRPVRYLGDMSYSVYLWHWPVLLLAPFVVGHELGTFGKLVSVGCALVLSVASYEWVEKPFQKGRLLRATRRAFVFAACGMALVAVPGAALWAVWLPRLAEQEQAAVSLEGVPCAGAQALLDLACQGSDPHGERLLISPLAAAADQQDIAGRVCARNEDESEADVCHFGLEHTDGVLEVALWGNSHAKQWLPALEYLSPELGLSVTTYLALTCFPTEPDSEASRLMASEHSCAAATVPELELILRSSPDLVVLSNLTNLPNMPDSAHDVLVRSSVWVLEQLADAGVPVLVIKDNPMPDPPVNIPNCLELNRNQPVVCDGSREAWVRTDPWVEAAELLGSPLVSVLDMDDGICGPQTCYAVVGGVIALQDDDHITSIYARSAAPQVAAAIKDAMKR
jgi:peptidoglycan/LPS O-acetylase OafA/YrhL